MKKSTLILAILVIAAAAIFLLLPDSDTTLRQEYKDFAIDDPEAVDSIFIANKEKYVILRKQEDGTWTVNNKFNAREDIMQTFLSHLSKLKDRAPISEAMHDRIVGRLISNGIKVEIYSNGEKEKEYYVGDNAIDEKATYMFIQGKGSIPYEVHVPGFPGYLNIYYNVNELDWKSKKLMAYKPEDIKSVEVIYYPEELRLESYRVERTNNGFTLTNLANPNIQPVNINQNALAAYFTQFKEIYHAGVFPGMTQPIADSIFNTTPRMVLKVTDVNGKTNKLAFHDKPVTKETKVQHDAQGNPLNRDLDLAYCFFNDTHDLVGIEYHSFSKYIKHYSDFFKSPDQIRSEQPGQ